MFKAIIILLLSLSGYDGTQKEHFSCASLYDEAQLQSEYNKQQSGLTYDQWKQAYYQELQIAKDGGSIEVLSGD